MAVKHELAALLLKNLNKKLDDFERLIRHPALFIDEYFSQVRNKIDFATDKSIVTLDKENGGQVDQIYQRRDAFIKELVHHERLLKQDIQKLDQEALSYNELLACTSLVPGHS